MPHELTIPKQRKRGAAVVVTSAAMVLALLGVAAPAQAAEDDGTLTVSVARTFTESGIADPLLDVPQQGMEVLVTDAEGDTVAGTTDADGAFVVEPSTELSGGAYRVEVAIPDAYDYLELAFASLGGDYGSHVGFVDVSDGADVTYRTAVWNPSDYVQADPALALPFQANFNSTASTDAVVEWTAGTLEDRDRTPAKTTTNTQSHVGTTYGTAYDGEGQRIFASAYAKRHAAYGPGGAGGIYVSDRSSGAAELFATIPNAGDTLHNDGNLRLDEDFFAAPGREGLGDIELSEDGSTLWVVNMHDKHLYSVDATSGDVTGDAEIPAPECVGGQWHPMGLGVQDGAVYVGGICDAFDSQDRTDLMAVVYRTADGVDFTRELEHPLDFLRGRANDPGVEDVNTHWNPWYDEYDPDKYYSAWVHAFPQPLLSDIDFDRDGSMLLGFRDRFGDQIGYDGLAPDGRHEGSGSAAAGDIIMVCLSDGTYTWEGEGDCPSNVTEDYTGGAANADTSEYFVGESVLNGNHQEPGLGSIAPIFRENDVAMTAIDAGNGAWQQGVEYLDLDDGTGMWRQGGRGSLDRGQLLSSGALTFGKGNGLGDISILADPAPIQIGNVVWFDQDDDGAQGPDEAPLPGVTVDLLDADGETVLATATTDENGEYYFSSLDTPLTSDGDFRVRFIRPEEGTVDLGGDVGEVEWNRMELTQQTAGENASIDSNPDSSTGVTDLIRTGAPGQDDHTIDAGYNVTPLSGYEHAKTSDPEPGTPVSAGDEITYTLTGSNTGEVPLDVDISDDLSGVADGAALTDGPDATVFAAGGDATGDAPEPQVDGDELTWNGEVPAGGHVEVVYTVTVDDDVDAGTLLRNRLSSVATPEDEEPIEPEDVVLEHPVPGYEHSKTSDPAAGTTVHPGDEVTYTVTGRNTGAVALDPVVVADDLGEVLSRAELQPEEIVGTVYDADGAETSTSEATVEGTELMWTGRLEPGEHVELVYTVTLAEDATGVVENHLSSEATPEDDDEPIEPEDIVLEHPIPGYEHSKTSDPAPGTPVVAGDEITYTLTGENTGATELDPVSLRDDLSGVLIDGVSLVGEPTVLVTDASGEEQGGIPAPELIGADLVWVGSLDPGETVEVEYTVLLGDDVEPGTVLHNTLSSHATDPSDDEITPEDEGTEHPVPGIDIVKFDARDGAAIPDEPVDGASAHGPTAGDWDAGVDADTEYDAVRYDVDDDGTTGPQPVGMIVTNTGAVALTNIEVSDETLGGPDLTDVVCDFSPLGGPSAATVWEGPFEPGDSFRCDSVLELASPQQHGDRASVDADAEVETTEGDVVVHLSDDDEFHAETPDESGIDITKRDEASGAEADTRGDALIAAAGSTRTIEMPARNTGLVPLRDVVVGDKTDVGAEIQDLSCTFPNGDVHTAGDDGLVRWEASFGDDGEAWLPGVEFLCTGELTIEAGQPRHADTISVSATTPSGEEVGDEDPFHAGVPAIDIVKFDAREQAPGNPVDGPAADGATPGDWAAAVDADSDADAARYGNSTGQQPVGMIVTNTGAAPLTNVSVSDQTLAGDDIRNLTCDFSDLGGPRTSTSWSGPLQPGDAFECTGELALDPDERHVDVASVTADALIVDEDGNRVTTSLGDSDAFHARSSALAVTGAPIIGAGAAVLLLGAGIGLYALTRRRTAQEA